jgi:DNA-binding CsgD family transcriptional regulator
MHLSTRESQALARIFELLAEGLASRELREQVGRALLDLLRADQFASYVWDGQAGRFADAVWLNMEGSNLARYESWFQYHDPITFELQRRRHATAVSEVMPHRELRRTEFFVDFLARDGLHWGINLHAFDGAHALGDLRIWRARQRSEFEPRDKALLDLVEPAFVAALRRARTWREPTVDPNAAGREATAIAAPADRDFGRGADSLVGCGPHPRSPFSARERAVAELIAAGRTDKEIARALGISVSSVRTYLRRLADKTGANRRAALACAVTGR